MSDTLNELLGKIRDGKHEILFLLAECFGRYVGQHDEWTLQIWMLAFTEMDCDCSTHSAPCVFETEGLFQRRFESTPLRRRAMIARLRSRILGLWDAFCEPHDNYQELLRRTLLRLHLVPCMIFGKECHRIDGLYRYASHCATGDCSSSPVQVRGPGDVFLIRVHNRPCTHGFCCRLLVDETATGSRN